MINSTELPIESLKWNLQQQTATEGQTFYITTADGHFGFIQLVYSTMSWSPIVQVTARFYASDGTKKSKCISPSSAIIVLEDDGLSSSCENLKIKLLSQDPISFHIVFKSTSELLMDIKFVAQDRGFQINDGKSLFALDDPTRGHVFSRFIPRAVVTGSIIVDGKMYSADGHGMLVNALQHKPQTAARWNFVNFHSDDHSIMMYQFEVPTSETPRVVAHGSLVYHGKLESVTIDNYAELGVTSPDDFSGYHIPENVSHIWRGHTNDGKTVKIEMAFNLNNLLDKIDVLGELPFLVRKFVQTFVTAPYIYQWFEEATAVITIGEEESVIVHGRVFHENVDSAYEIGWLFVQEYYTFLNKEPAKLHCFYNTKSSFVRGNEGEMSHMCQGQNEIHDRISEIGFQNCKVLVSNVDAQASTSNGIIVQVLGEMSNNGGFSHKFAQTFFLAEQPNGYYVLNDIFRFLKEDIDTDYDEQAEAVVESVKTSHSIPKKEVEKVAAVIPEPKLVPETPKPVSQPAKPVAIAPPVIAAPTPLEKPANWAEKNERTDKHEKVHMNVQKTTSTNTSKASVVHNVERKAPANTVEKVTIDPPKPKTWAIAATISSANAVPIASAAVSKSQSPAKKHQNREETTVTASVPNVEKEEIISSGFNRRENNRNEENIDKEKYSVYIRGLQEGIDRNAINESFKKFGSIVKIDVVSTRNIAFVEFKNLESASKAIATNTIIVNDITLIIEERKKTGNKKPGYSNGYHGNKENHSNRNNRSGSAYHQQRKQEKSVPVQMNA